MRSEVGARLRLPATSRLRSRRQRVLGALLVTTIALQGLVYARVFAAGESQPLKVSELSSGQSITADPVSPSAPLDATSSGAKPAPRHSNTAKRDTAPASPPRAQVGKTSAAEPSSAARATPRGATPRRTTASARPRARASASSSPVAAAKPVSNDIQRSGTSLTLRGQNYRFTGIDAYGIATLPGHNAGCDAPTSDADLDGLFASLRPDSLVRFWGFQQFAVNPNTKQLDWTGIDRVFAAADRHHQRLIITLGDQAGVCDNGHWHDVAWFQGDDHKVFNDDGRGVNILSYWDWVDAIVARYARDPAVGMWEPLNEPEDSNCAAGYTGGDCYAHKSCPGGTTEVLRDWYTTLGGEIRRLDPVHLISAGLLGLGECGQQGNYFGWIAASPGIDVMTIHDYGVDPAWDGSMDDRLRLATAAGKPLMLEEWGTNASDTSGEAGCAALSTRAAQLTSKLQAIFAHTGMVGMTPWHWEAGGGICSTEITTGDPAMTVLHDYPL